jgi:hypothetical protein
MDHRFRLGQMVRLSRRSSYQSMAEGTYQVVRQLPYGDGEYQYRIKSAREQHERVVKESELDRA